MMDKLNKDHNITLFKVLAFLGGALIFFGIVFFISLNWYQLNDFLKIFTTLIAALVSFLVAKLFEKSAQPLISTVFYMITGLLLPVGLYVTFDVAHLLIYNDYRTLIITAICFLFFAWNYNSNKTTIFLLFTIIFASLFYYSLIVYLTNHSYFRYDDIYQYALILLGMSYISLGRYLYLIDNKYLVGPLYFIGVFLVLFNAYWIGGLFFISTAFSTWKILTVLFIILSFVLAPFFQSKSFLYLGTLFLVIYLFDMTSRFIDVFGKYGWPLVLVLLGFFIIILSFIVVKIHQYMSYKTKGIAKQEKKHSS